MHKLVLSVALLAMLPGCAANGVVANLTTQTPAQVKTFAEAENAAAIVVKATAAWVRATNPTRAQLAPVDAAKTVVIADVAALRNARDKGEPMVFTALNLALRNYAAAKGN